MQGVGGAFLMANSSAILTDAFPANQRGLALGMNGVAAIAGSFLGLVIGGVLAPIDWNLVFLVSVPIGVIGTVWAYLKLHDTGVRKHAKMDWWGNITFALGLGVILIAITAGIQPHRGHSTGWTNPVILGALSAGAALLVVFVLIERRAREPMFQLGLFRIRAFAAGNAAGLAAAVPRGRCEEGRGAAAGGNPGPLERAEGRRARLSAGPAPAANRRRRIKEPV